MSKVVNSKYVDPKTLHRKGWYQSKQYITGIDFWKSNSRNGLLDMKH